MVTQPTTAMEDAAQRRRVAAHLLETSAHGVEMVFRMANVSVNIARDVNVNIPQDGIVRILWKSIVTAG